MNTEPPAEGPPQGRYLTLLALGALGVVFGDIGTSVLYSLRECFSGPSGVAPTHENVLGILSLVFWSLTTVVSVWYLAVVMRADNRGEGGILALTALLGPMRSLKFGERRPLWMALGIFGAALLYGDGMITPAISVLSAVEGLNVATPVLEPYVVPIVLLILVALFAAQRHGTTAVGNLFGPVMVAWFVVIAVLGLAALGRHPQVLAALNPLHAVRFFAENGFRGFESLGAVFLCVTGAEALYADMGHFGRRPIRYAWYALALPALLLNYFGQGALLLFEPDAAENPFFRLAPAWGTLPLVALATVATVIASQAVISGAFSLTRQAVQLGLAPPLAIRHTSARTIGQIYVPSVNWALLAATAALVVGFGTSSRLASAYGIAVTGTMAITVFLTWRAMIRIWRVRLAAATAAAGVVMAVVLAFFGANSLKIAHGGWVPLAVGVGGYLLLTTWQRGRQLLSTRLSEVAVPLPILLGDIGMEPPKTVRGTAVYMTGQPDGVPHTLLYNLRHNQVLHERVVFLTVQIQEIPRVANEDRVSIGHLGERFHRVTARFGFMEEPDVEEVLVRCREKGFDVTVEGASFFVGRETLLSTARPGMPIWREKLFALMSRNTPRVTAGWNLPADQVIEIGAQIEL